MEICIKPIGVVDPDVLEFLENALSQIFGSVKVLAGGKVPSEAYNPARNQYNSTFILLSLDEDCDVILGVTEVDLYANNLTFVFGEAELGGRRAIISLRRLRPEFYGMPYDESLLKLRALKEAVHEIGHVLGLRHCFNPRCVMYFSNTILDTDFKDWRYCEECRRKLVERGILVKFPKERVLKDER